MINSGLLNTTQKTEDLAARIQLRVVLLTGTNGLIIAFILERR
jgi:hypothetical protein